MSGSKRDAAPKWPRLVAFALLASAGVAGWLLFGRGDPNVGEIRLLQRNPAAREAHHQGELAVARGDSADAVRGFATAARLEPKSALARLNLALAQARSGDSKAAVVSARSALELRPDWAQAWIKLAHFYADTGDLTHAQEAALRGADLAPDDAEAWLARGRVSLLQGDLKLAELSARTALRKYQRSPAGWLALGDVLLRKPGNQGLPEALSAFGRAVELENSAYTLLRLGEAERRAGKPSQAAEHLRAAVRLAPADAVAAFQLAQVLGELKDPEAETWSARARKLQERRYALSSLQRKVAQNPGDAALQARLAQELERGGDRAAALRAYKTANSLDPENEGIRRALVRLEAGGSP